MWKICENQKIVEKFGAEISGLIGGENRCCNQLRSKCKNHGGKSELQKRADRADQSVLIFPGRC